MNKLKPEKQEEGENDLSDFIGKLKLQGSDGKMYPSDVANPETLFRIIQKKIIPPASRRLPETPDQTRRGSADRA